MGSDRTLNQLMLYLFADSTYRYFLDKKGFVKYIC